VLSARADEGGSAPVRVAALERGGQESQDARKLLRQFEAWVALHVADCDRLWKEL